MKYRLRHYTHYNYSKPVAQSHNQLRMLLRDVPYQRCTSRSVRIRPTPAYAKLHLDHFKNRVLYVEQDQSHHDARLFLTQIVEVLERHRPEPQDSPAWEHIVAALTQPVEAETRLLELYRIPSKVIQIPADIGQLTAPHFQPNRPIIAAVSDLCTAIFNDFEFEPHATTVSTPVADVLKKRQGVCQDFAHLMIAALRNQGLAARYVSGYIETLPPEGQPRLVGADASHAWVSVWCGHEAGWQDFDPTNNQRPNVQHITTAWGRDYDDVIPLNGVIFGDGGKSILTVRVDVERLG
ncbi:MAG: transglutaminase family protein [Oceanococcus sp.]